MKTIYSLLLITFVLSSCAKLPVDTAILNNAVHREADSVTFAVIGDFGTDDPQEADVAAIVKSWKPDFIVTTGDNNYPVGAASTIHNNIGKHYCDFIYNPDAPEAFRCKGKAAAEGINRFFPIPGNHDCYSIPELQPYLDYFTLPGDERNYDFSWGPVHFFTINTGKFGKVKCCDSPEAKWLTEASAGSKKPFRFLFCHHPPYSTSNHGHNADMQWPYKNFGIQAVFSGHDHVYQRILDRNEQNFPYIVCGNSGKAKLYDCGKNPLPADRFDVLCDDKNYGALKVKVTPQKAVIEYYTIAQPNAPSDVYIIYP